MRLNIVTVGDLIRELQKYPPYMEIFNENGKVFEQIQYNNKIPSYNLTKNKWEEKEGIKLI